MMNDPTLGLSSRQTQQKTLSGGALLAVIVGIVAVIGIAWYALTAVSAASVQRTRLADSRAKSDLSSLALAIAKWYLPDAHDGSTPIVVEQDGQYVVDGTYAVPISEGVRLGGVEGTSSSNWCVWTTNPDGTVKDWEWSAADGLHRGRCD